MKNIYKKTLKSIPLLIFIVLAIVLLPAPPAFAANCSVSGSFSGNSSPYTFRWNSTGTSTNSVHITCSGGINSNGDYDANGPAEGVLRYSTSDIACTISGVDNAGAACSAQANLTIGGSYNYNLACVPANINPAVGTTVRIDAKSVIPVSPIQISPWAGGDVSWSAPGGNPASGTGTSFNTSYSSDGTKIINVSSGTKTSSCSVTVGTGTPPTSCVEGTISAVGGGGGPVCFQCHNNAWTQLASCPTGTPPASGNKFNIGDRVQATTDLHVRSAPGATSSSLGTVSSGRLGTVKSTANANPQNVTGTIWWYIQWDATATSASLTGWSSENYLVLASGGGGPPPGGTAVTVPVTTNGVVGVTAGSPPKYYGPNGRYVIQKSEFGFFWLDTQTMTGGHVQAVAHCGALGGIPPSASGHWVIADCNSTDGQQLSADGTQVVTVMTSGQCIAQRSPTCSGARDDGHWSFVFGLGTWDYKGDYPTDPVTGSPTPALIESSTSATDPQGRVWQLRPDPANLPPPGTANDSPAMRYYFSHFLWTSSGGTVPPGSGQHLACVNSACTLVSGAGANQNGCMNVGTTCVPNIPPTALSCAEQYPGNATHQNLCEQIKALQRQLCLLSPSVLSCSL